MSADIVQKKNRLTQRADFRKIYRLGKSTANHHFVLYVLPHQSEQPFRLGISVSTKVGNAVVRNRLRRMIKEIVRLNSELIARPMDLIVIVRRPSAGIGYHELEKSLLHVLRKAALLLPRKS